MPFVANNAYEDVRVLARDIGPRFAGTHNEKQAAEYLRDRFEKHGLEAALEPFLIRPRSILSEELEVEGLGRIPCEALLGSPAGRNQVRGPMLFVEGGEECDVGPDAEGKVLLIYGEAGGLKYRALMARKPAAIVVLESAEGIHPKRHNLGPELVERHGSVPTVRVEYADSRRLMEARGSRATVTVEATDEEATAYNVRAELPGSDKPDEIVVVCGHFDSIYEGPGTLDNATGTAMVMELARVLREEGTNRTLRFYCFSGEEQGLRGSIYAVREMRKADKEAKKDKAFLPAGKQTELDKHRLCVNMDLHGSLLAKSAAWYTGPDDLGASVRLLAAEIGTHHEVRDDVYSSDNAPYSDAGVPAISFARTGPLLKYGHTDEDRFEHCEPEGLQVSGDFVLGWFERHVTKARAFPFEREISPEHRKKLDKYFRDRLLLRMDEGLED
jgi:aminopeptidase YwaD